MAEIVKSSGKAIECTSVKLVSSHTLSTLSLLTESSCEPNTSSVLIEAVWLSSVRTSLARRNTLITLPVAVRW